MNMIHRAVFLLFMLSTVMSCKDSEPRPSSTFADRMENKLYPQDGWYKDKNYPFQTFGLQAYKSGLKQAQQQLGNTRAGEWTQQGPGNIGGRVNTIAVNPEDGDEMFLGYSIGGIHKTVNGGASWYPVFDDQITTAISDVAYDPQDNDVMYAGTGDLNITGYPVAGNGIYKSVDRGESWVQSGLVEAGIISEVAVSHQNSQVIYAASMGVPFAITPDRGFYKSTDGGQTWEQKLAINGYTGIIDIEVSPIDDNIIYAASWSRISAYSQNVISSGITRILKSEDGGETWDYLINDLPDGTLVRPGLAMFPSDDDVVYALFSRYVDEDEDLECTEGYYVEGIYKTEDGGDSWVPLPLIEENGWRCSVVGGFSWYFGKIRVNPLDQDDVFVLGVDMMRTRDGGASWEEATPRWWTYEVHADKHDLVFSGIDMILGTDGGAYRSNIFVNNWEDIENIVSTQFYRVGYNPHEPEWYYGGAQDNGTTGGNEAEINNWPRIFGGDGFGVQFHPTDSSTYYVETQRGNISRHYENEFGGGFYRITDSISDEGRANWDMPYFIGADDPGIVYCGREKVWRTVNEDQDQWEAMSPILVDLDNQTIANSHTISALAQSTVDPDMFFVGTSDGYIWRSLDDGANWERVGLDMPERYYSDVRPSPTDASRVYASITGYEDNDFTPYIYMSQDSGRTFVQIEGNMPQVAVNDIFVPGGQVEENTVVIGTDAGVYVTLDQGVNWNRLGDNMPIFPVFDLAYNEAKDELIAGTHARGIWTIPMTDLLAVSTKESKSTLVATLYPTLATDQVRISAKPGGYDYQIFDMQGRLTLSGNVQAEQPIDVSTVRSGAYVVLIQHQGQVTTKKIIKM